MSADQRIEAELTLDDGQYRVRMKGAGAEARRFKRDIERLNASVMKSEKGMRKHITSVRDWAIIIGQSRNVLHQLWFVTGKWMTSVIKTQAEVERLTFLMKGMSKEISELDRSAEAASNVAKLFEFAKSAPFSMNALSDSFVKFKSVGLDPLDGSMQSLVDATAAFGGTDETLHRASIAIQQMAGKGVISMEELRQQLGEAVPQAITIMANSMGASYGAMVKKISEGKVAAEPALKAMFGGFEMAFGGRAQAMMETFQGRVARLKTAWTELVSTNPGLKDFYSAVKDVTQELTKFLQGPAASDFASGFGAFLANVTRGMGVVISNIDYAWSLAQGWAAFLKNESMDESSWLWKVKAWSAEIAQNFRDSSIHVNRLTEAGQVVLPNGMVMSEEDAIAAGYDPKTQSWGTQRSGEILKERLRGGLFIDSSELEQSLDVYDEFIVNVDQKVKDVEDAKARLTQALVANSGRGELTPFTAEMMTAAKANLVEIDGAMTLMRDRLDQIEQDKVKLVTDYMSTNVGPFDESAFMDKNGEAFSRLNTESREAAQRLEDLRVEYQTVYRNIKAASPADLIATEFGDIKFDGFETRLQELARSSVKAVAEQAQAVLDLQRNANAAKGDLETMAATLGTVMDAAASEMTDPLKKEADAIISSGRSTFQQLMAENSLLFQDATLSHDEMVSQMEANNADFIATQIARLTELQTQATESLSAQGETGMMAAAIFAEYISGLIENLQNGVDKYAENLKRGMVLVDNPGGDSKIKTAQASLDEMIKSAENAGETLNERFINPLAYVLPNAIESARTRIDKLAKTLSGGAWTQQMKDLFHSISMNAVSEEMLKIRDASKEIRRSLMGERAMREEVYQEEVQRLKDMRAKLVDQGLWRVEWEGIVQDQLRALEEQFVSSSPLGQYSQEWKSFFDNIESWGVDTFKGLSDELADFVVDGEMDIAGFARSALKSFMSIQFNSLFSAGTSWLGGRLGFGVSHAGSIVGETGGRQRIADAAVFANAPRYHTGGIAGNEVPTILEKGEGVFTEGQMAAIGKGMSPPNIQMNIINNSGAQVSEDSKPSVRFDGKNMILDVVLEGVGKPGPFRDGMKGALST